MRSLSVAALLCLGVHTSAHAETGAERLVTLDGFAIDATEVTIAEFRAFKESSGRRTEAERQGSGFEWDGGWVRRHGWTVNAPFGRPPESEREPAVHVNWDEASAYCDWRGGRLPTAAQWSSAAYREERAQPVDGFTVGRTYQYAVGDRPEGMNTNDADPWPTHVVVGSTKRGVNGLFDMGGNVWEWLADRRGEEALTAGGSWWYGAEQTVVSSMQWKPADFYAVYVGFRCVY